MEAIGCGIEADIGFGGFVCVEDVIEGLIIGALVDESPCPCLLEK